MLQPWLSSYYQSVTAAWEKGVMPHALLLTGLKGVGKHALADAIARFVLCENKQNNQACGTCRSCQLLAADAHPDRLTLTLEEKSKVIKIAQVRQLSEQLNTTAFSQYQVVTIVPACQMNTAAANALLKTLEEPTERVLMILLAHDASRLPATVLSRCQRMHVAIQDAELALTWLKSTYPNQQPERLWQHTQGAPLLAEQLLSQEYFVRRDQVLQTLTTAATGKHNPLPVAADWATKEVPVWLRLLFLLTTDCIKLRSSAASVGVVNEDCREQILVLSSCLSVTSWFQFYEQLLQAQAALASGIAINAQLLLEGVLLDWCALNRGSLRGSGLC